jgi:ribosomal protein S18 acetylase RimI-like enzyme
LSDNAERGLVIEPLGRRHDRGEFSSGEPPLDDWFRNRASQDEKRNVSRVFVAVDSQLRIVGFYSVSAYSLAIADLPEPIQRKLPRYGVVPAALIGRLARDLRVRGQKVGELLLADAVKRILTAARSMAVFAIIVDAKNERASAFYQAFGFQPFPSRRDRLFLVSASVPTEI